jgi:signal transduction histidine kinase/CheY-like chemotaxis protein
MPNERSNRFGLIQLNWITTSTFIVSVVVGITLIYHYDRNLFSIYPFVFYSAGIELILALTLVVIGIALYYKTRDGNLAYKIINEKIKSQKSLSLNQAVSEKLDAEDAKRQLETKLYQDQKMETLGTLAGGIAHDFNNLLTGIVGYQELALDQIDSEHPAKHYMTEARKASIRACELVEQILQFSRRAENTKKSIVVIDLLLEESRGFLRATLPSTINIEFKVSPNCGSVKCESTQLNQIILNLASNSAHAMPKGGKFSVTAEPEIIDSKSKQLVRLAPGNYVHLQVSDTGSGMSQETLQHIFDPFFTTKQHGEGTGLGLAIVHGLINTIGGEIKVSSTIGVGTKFDIWLPSANPTNVEPTSGIDARVHGDGEVICIVDDEQLVAQTTRLTLQKAGFNTVVFNSGKECLKLIKDQPASCSLIICDQTMPGMPGSELAQSVRLINKKIPMIIMSGNFNRIPTEQIKNLDNISLIEKPFTSLQITTRVKELLNKKL